MSASWLNYVSSLHQGAPMRSVRCSHRDILPEQSLLNDGICFKLHLSSLTVLEFQLSQFIPASHGSTPLVIGAGSWSDTQWLIWVQLLSVTHVPFHLQSVRRVYIAGVDEWKAPGSQNEVSAVCVLLLLCAGPVHRR